MARLMRAWRSLSRLRQTLMIVLLILALVQGLFLCFAGLSILLPALALTTLLGGVLIYGSRSDPSVTRAARESRKRLQRLESLITQLGDDLRSVSHGLKATEGRLESLNNRVIALDAVNIDLQRVTREVRDEARGSRAAIGQTARELSAKFAAVSRDGEQRTTALHSLAEDLLANVRAESEAIADVRRLSRAINSRVGLAFDGGNSHSLERRIVAEMSALMLLQSGDGTFGLPPIDGWAMSPLSLHFLASASRRLSPDSTIVELGSGVSTAWIAHTLSGLSDRPRFIAVDHDRDFAQLTGKHLANLGLSEEVTLVCAPLVSASVGEDIWYGTEWVEEATNISLLIVDGPPAGTRKNARYPALPTLLDRLSDQATIFVDDADRPGEAGMIDQWLAFPGIRREMNVGRSAVLRYDRIAGDS